MHLATELLAEERAKSLNADWRRAVAVDAIERMKRVELMQEAGRQQVWTRLLPQAH